MTWSRPFFAGLLLALASQGASALVPTCAVGTPACCVANTDCDDGDSCTGLETCDLGTGTCAAGTAIVCDDLDPCTDDACDPAQGRCLTSPATDGTGCNDQNACTQADTCQGGVCFGADPVVCDDDNDCTADTCIPTSGACSFIADEDGSPCDDGDACSQLDVCLSGTCTGTQPIDCGDTNACTDDACEPATGACTHAPAADATPCDDGDGCTQTDACSAGTCIGTNPLACDDAVPCTVDACVAGACVATPTDARCADGECFDGVCAPGDPAADAEGCVPLPARADAPCTDDGATCTDDRCASGLCVHLPVATRCLADDPCAMSTCAPTDAAADVDGCVVSAGQPDGAACTEDLDPCTWDRCEAGACLHESVTNRDACEPVRDPFRQALVLAAFSRALADELAATPGIDAVRVTALLAQTDRLATGLDATAAELNGADPTAETAKDRARRAITPVKRLPREASRLVRLIKLAGKRDPVEPAAIERLGRSAIDLRLGVRELKRDIRRLRRALRRFVQ